MKKYKVTFEFLNSLGVWKSDYLSNNEIGFSYPEAIDIRNDLNSHGSGSISVRNVKIEEVEK